MEQNLAVLIDFENIAAGTEKEGLGRFDVKTLMQRFKDKGRVLIARSYADWGRFSRFKQGLLTENVTMMELTSHGMQDKNRADIALVVDALELAFTREYIDTFVVVSGDSDFTPMVTKMRELNKRVIGCGTRKSTSRLLIQACDEFIFYDSIVKPAASKKRRPRAKQGGNKTAENAFGLLVDALEGLQREDPNAPLAGLVKQAMLRKTPDFSESDLGYGTFTRFLKAAEDAGYVKLSRDSKSGGFRVDGVEGNDEASDDASEQEESSGWEDEYLPAGVDAWVDALSEAGIAPLSTPVRMDVLEALSEVVAARRKRRRKSTMHFASEDVKKQLRRTHPNLPLELIRGVLEALRLAGQLIHRDGGPIRTASAGFMLDKDAVGLNKALLGTYLGALREANCELVDSKALAGLFLGDVERAREVEEALAWLATDGGEPSEDLNSVDLDDLLVTNDAKADAKAEEPAKKKTKKSASKKKDDAEAEAEAAKSEDEADAKAEEEVEAKSKTKTKTKTKAKAKEEAPAEEEAAPAEASAEEKPKPKTKRRRVRKKKEPATEPAPSDLDSLLEPAADAK